MLENILKEKPEYRYYAVYEIEGKEIKRKVTPDKFFSSISVILPEKETYE